MAYTDIDDPSKYFQIALYAGNGTGQTITNDGNSDLKPDFLWFKNRSETVANTLWDSSRGITKFLVSEQTAAEYTNASGYELTSFNTDGFGLGGHNNAGINQSSSYNYVSWQWKANGGTTANNTTGSINSVVQANQDAGFSIITYTGNATNSTVGHGLGVQPSVIINKKRGATASWSVWHSTLLGTQLLELNTTGATATVAAIWNSTVPTSSVFSIGTDGQTNSNNTTYVTYAFAEKQGYSKFGSYKGNTNADGAFVYTGFKPAWLMVKRASYTAGDGWYIFDNKRNTSNVTNKILNASSNGVESSSAEAVDFLSNGFKLRTALAGSNSGSTYIYMAFAENPFVTSTGIPTTAR